MPKSFFNYFILLMGTVISQPGFADPKVEWEKYVNQTKTSFKTFAEAEEKTWEMAKNRVLQKWNDGALPAQKVYVKYFEDDFTRAKIDYENGTVVIETLQESNNNSPIKAKESIQKTLSSIIDSDSSLDSILVKDEISNSTMPTSEIVSTIIKDISADAATPGSDKVSREHYQVTFKLVPNFIKLRASKLRPTVEIWAQKYNLDPAFILAIIRQESSFNPKARSKVGAIGLMQIMPQFAGSEVLKAVTGKNITPGTELLYDPAQNIMIGSTYLQLLRDQYFSNVKENEKRIYLMTASYNWGPHRIKTAIKKGRLSEKASSDEIFDRLQQIAPSETQEYLRKVKTYTSEFRGKN